ncbi:hypothetical protein GGF32_000505 [Allomyces javanicus]|nr:hypothetical protein GGF32_000505 [Allomyces javanicus]
MDPRHSSVDRPLYASVVAPPGIPPQEHTPPSSSPRDLAVFEERLRSNLTYFRRRRRKYRLLQLALFIGVCLGFHGGFMADDHRWIYYLRVLFLACVIGLFAVHLGADYQRTVDQARMFSPRVNRVLHSFNIAFNRPGRGPELSFSNRVPAEIVSHFDLARQDIQRSLARLYAGKPKRK